jgi:Sulfatase-modifying factor enzyme 1
MTVCLRMLFFAALLVAWRPAPAASPPAGRPFINSLGQRFVPLPKSDVFFAVWETRNRDYSTFLKANNSGAPAAWSSQPDHPVRNVNWDDAVAFCNWLTATERKLGRIGTTDRYRLPTDREWDIALGANKWPWGNYWPTLDQRPKLPGFVAEKELTANVGSYAPNAFGIHDLGGNVMEWLHDWYDRDMNSRALRKEFGRLEDDGGGRVYKVLRGQSWVFFDAQNLLAEYRYPNLPRVRGGLYGFRCVLEPEAGARLIGPAGARVIPSAPVFDAAARRGRELYLGRCNECHQHFDPSGYDDASWSDWMGKMRGKAKIGGSDAADVDRFLQVIRTHRE